MPPTTLTRLVCALALSHALAACSAREPVNTPGCPQQPPGACEPCPEVASEPPPCVALAPAPEPEPPPRRERVVLGIDRLLDDQDAAFELVRGKRVGLITNASGVDGELRPSADRLAADARLTLAQLYAPEHGLRGAQSAGDEVDDGIDPQTGVPVESLYGDRLAPSAESLAGIDVLLFDLQDVGSRTYTFASTLGHAMKAAAAAKVPFVVLDRPNPLGGLLFEGPVREERHKSFIGWGPLPVSHGMTFGELARFYNRELDLGVELHVVEMQHWRRDMTWEDTGLYWVPTSPNIPHINNARLYIATGMVAGASDNIDEGAGYTMPFETLAATFIEPAQLAAALEAADLPGVRFRAVSYEKRGGRLRNQPLHGVQLIITDPATFRPLRTALTALVTLEKLYPGQFAPRSTRSFARIWGNTEVLEAIRAGDDVATIEASWQTDLERFAEARKAALIYP